MRSRAFSCVRVISVPDPRCSGTSPKDKQRVLHDKTIGGWWRTCTLDSWFGFPRASEVLRLTWLGAR